MSDLKKNQYPVIEESKIIFFDWNCKTLDKFSSVWNFLFKNNYHYYKFQIWYGYETYIIYNAVYLFINSFQTAWWLLDLSITI